MIINLRPMRPYWKPLGIAVLTLIPGGTANAAGYVPGTIRTKAQPIIDLLKEGSEPIAYGMYIWSGIKFILGHKAEAKDMVKGATYGVVGIKLIPWFFDILNSVGV
ncbi:MAG: hypothetical protein ACOYIG_07480 [Acetivibrionales bacterium]|jgi:hypothetical protein